MVVKAMLLLDRVATQKNCQICPRGRTDCNVTLKLALKRSATHTTDQLQQGLTLIKVKVKV